MLILRNCFSRVKLRSRRGNLDDADHAFRAVLAINPQVAGAYANLGVIYMRRKQWTQALEMLHKAQRLAPEMAGVRLNIGLVYYRQNDFRKAIPPFESVVHDAPDSFQARYLLGLCYFFVERYGDAARTLEPLWSQASGQLNYLYVLGIAANKAGQFAVGGASSQPLNRDRAKLTRVSSLDGQSLPQPRRV